MLILVKSRVGTKCIISSSFHFTNASIALEVHFVGCHAKLLHPELRNINPRSVTHSLVSQNPREQMFVVQISLLIVTFPLPYITQFAINANHPRSQPTPSHCTMCQHVKCHLLILVLHHLLPLMPLVDCWCVCLPHRPGKAKSSGPHQRTRWRENEFKLSSHLFCVIP